MLLPMLAQALLGNGIQQWSTLHAKPLCDCLATEFYIYWVDKRKWVSPQRTNTFEFANVYHFKVANVYWLLH